MHIRNVLFLLNRFVLFILLSLSLYGAAKKNIPETSTLIKNQKILMGFVKTYFNSSSSKLITALCKEAFEKIFRIYIQTGKKEEVLSFFSELVSSPRFKNLHPYAYYYLGNIYGKEQKERYLLRSLKSSETDYDRQTALNWLYRFYKEEKKEYLALAYLTKSIEVQKKNRDVGALELSYLTLGEIFQRKRDYLTALDYYFEALVYSQKRERNNSGKIYLNISEVFRILNRKELAKMYIKRILDYTTKQSDPDLEVKALSTYSKLFYEEESYAEALHIINLALQEENNSDHYVCAISLLYQKARILLKLNSLTAPNGNTNSNEAMALLKKAVDMGLKKKEYEGLLPIMSEYIKHLINGHKFAEAHKYLERIDDIYAPYYPYYFFYDYLMAFYYQKKNEMDSALNYYQQTIDKLERFFSGLEDQQYYLYAGRISEIYVGIIEFFLEMYDRTDNHIYIKKALFFSEIKNSYIYELNTLKNKSHSHFASERAKLEKEFVKLNKKYMQLLKNANSQDQQQIIVCENQLELLKRQYDELKEFILESPITYKKYSFKVFDLAKIQKRLNAGQMILKYAVLKENIYVFCIDYRSTGYWKLTGSSQSIINKVKQLTAPLDDYTLGNVDYLRINYDLHLAHQLYTILVKDTWAFRSNIDELFIIPDDELFKLPFEALVTGFNQRELMSDTLFSEYASANYLIEKLPVSYFFSLFHFQEKPVHSKEKRYFLAAFGNPIVQSMEEGDETRWNGQIPGSFVSFKKGENWVASEDLNPELFKEIPSTGKEISTISSIMKSNDIQLFLGEKFNRWNFEKVAPQAKILHIATHFINNTHYPQYSALLFSAFNDSKPFYYAHEIFNLKLENDLVVLSACESSEKHLLGLQGMRGMTASFKQAGARAVLVSMWPVDEHSSELSSLFYSEYRRNPKHSAIPAALRSAKLQLMKRTTPLRDNLKLSFAHPFLWANYILYRFN